MNTQSSTTPRRNLDDLKARTDLRRLAADLLGTPKKRFSRYDMHRSPLRDDGKNASFAVYADGFHDYGGAREHGSAIDFLMRVEKLTFAQAVARLEQIVDGTARIEPVSRPQHTAHDEPPDAIWQDQELKALKRCQDYLWSDRPDARRVRADLHGRGLTDDTIRAFGLGFCPRWHAIGWKDPAGKAAGVWPGIVIPIFYNKALWALRVREFEKPLAAKYLNVTGSKLSGALFNGDAIQPGAPVLIVEGEFDAMLAGQLLAGVTVVTPGPVSNTLTKRQLEHIKQASAVYVLMDSDEPGQRAAQSIAAQFNGCQKDYLRTLTLPAGKDITEYVCEHGGDLAAWFATATRPVPFPNGVPDKWRSVLLNRKYFPDSFAVGLELLNEACRTGLLNPLGFTTGDYLNANKQLGFNLSEGTARQLLKQFVGVFLRDVDGKESEGNLPSTSQKNPGGRPTKAYQVLNCKTMRTNMLNWISPRLYEQYHPATPGRKNVLAEVTPAMLRDSGVSNPNAVANELHQTLQPAFDIQENVQRWTSQRATAHFERIARSLDDLHSTPLPTGWPLNNAKAYREAFAHVVAGGGQRSRRELCDLLGVKNTALSGVLERAGIEQSEPQYAEVQITSVDNFERQVERIGRYTVKGMPCEVRAELPDGRVLRREYGPHSAHLAADTFAAGGRIYIKFRIANKQIVVRDTPPEPSERRESSGSSSSTPRTTRHYGPTYSQTWLVAQYWLALKLLGWVQRGDDRLINPTTGEVAHRDMTPLALLTCILGRELTNGPVYLQSTG